MFVARTGINTRRYEGQSGLTALLAPKKKTENQRFYCWVPCMLGPCIGGLVGLVILLGGAAMCTTGYYAKHFASSPMSNGSHIVTQVDRSKEFHMYNMTFVGPVIMGCGCFVIIIACVVVCEQRDKDIRIKAEAEKLQGSKKNKKKKEFYHAVVNRLKKSQVYNSSFYAKTDSGKNEQEKQGTLKSPSKKFKLIPCLDDAGSQVNVRSRGKYSHIGDALKNIPVEIFSVDLEQKQGSTLLPVRVKSEIHLEKPETVEQKKCLLHKFPSAACIHDLLKINHEQKVNRHLSKPNTLKRSTSDLYLDQTETVKQSSTSAKPDTTELKYTSETEISGIQRPHVKDSVVITVEDSRNIIPAQSPTASESFILPISPQISSDNQSDQSEPQVIHCQASIHPEQQQTIKQVTNTLNIAQSQHREAQASLPDEDHVDTQVLAITSGIARANAAGMDMFLKKPVKSDQMNGDRGIMRHCDRKELVANSESFGVKRYTSAETMDVGISEKKDHTGIECDKGNVYKSELNHPRKNDYQKDVAGESSQQGNSLFGPSDGLSQKSLDPEDMVIHSNGNETYQMVSEPLAAEEPLENPVLDNDTQKQDEISLKGTEITDVSSSDTSTTLLRLESYDTIQPDPWGQNRDIENSKEVHTVISGVKSESSKTNDTDGGGLRTEQGQMDITRHSDSEQNMSSTQVCEEEESGDNKVQVKVVRMGAKESTVKTQCSTEAENSMVCVEI